ncbi:MAG: hypothetical protein MMC33_006765 [Icmadophila ericetorum]|nr:hypothetical protein [Icmadophila ericetorum]
MSSQILPSNVTAQAFLAAELVIIIVPALFVALRLWNNLRLNKRILIDDWLAVLALCLLTATAVFYYEEITNLDSPTTTLRWIGNVRRRELISHNPRSGSEDVFVLVITASSFIALFGSYFAKAPILIMYVRIFGVKTWLRNICYGLLVADFLFAAGPAVYLTVVCQPNRQVLDVAWLDRCIDNGLAIGVWNGSVAVFTDLVIFILPLPVIAKLHLARSRKISLAMVFMVGFLGLTASSVTLYFRGTSLAADGTSANEVGQMLGQSIELSIAIIVGCVPAIRALWFTHVIDMPLYSKPLSSFSSRRSKRTQTQMLPASKEAPSGASTENMVPPAHAYVELSVVKVPMATHYGAAT